MEDSHGSYAHCAVFVVALPNEFDANLFSTQLSAIIQSPLSLSSDIPWTLPKLSSVPTAFRLPDGILYASSSTLYLQKFLTTAEATMEGFETMFLSLSSFLRLIFVEQSSFYKKTIDRNNHYSDQYDYRDMAEMFGGITYIGLTSSLVWDTVGESAFKRFIQTQKEETTSFSIPGNFCSHSTVLQPFIQMMRVAQQHNNTQTQDPLEATVFESSCLVVSGMTWGCFHKNLALQLCLATYKDQHNQIVTQSNKPVYNSTLFDISTDDTRLHCTYQCPRNNFSFSSLFFMSDDDDDDDDDRVSHRYENYNGKSYNNQLHIEHITSLEFFKLYRKHPATIHLLDISFGKSCLATLHKLSQPILEESKHALVSSMFQLSDSCLTNSALIGISLTDPKRCALHALKQNRRSSLDFIDDQATITTTDEELDDIEKVYTSYHTTSPQNKKKDSTGSLPMIEDIVLDKNELIPSYLHQNQELCGTKKEHYIKCSSFSTDFDSYKIKAFEEERYVLKRYISNSKPDVAIMLLNIQRLKEQYERWRRELPYIQVHYAVKSNSDMIILKTLAELGIGFDCASETEINAILTSGLNVSSQRIIYSNPCKQAYALTCALKFRIPLTVFDNYDELLKIKELYPTVNLLLRIKTDDSESQCPLSNKFGASRQDWHALLSSAQQLQLNIVGVHFHVGSGCSKLGCFTLALKDTREVFELAETFNFNMNIINIGGGFPGTLLHEDINDAKTSSLNPVTFEALSQEIRNGIETYFPACKYKETSLQFLAEPGRFFSSPACSLAVKVFARGTRTNEDGCIYYINDGLYGSFNNILFDHAKPEPEVLITQSNAQNNTPSAFDEQKQFLSCIFGQTCDGLDKVCEKLLLPALDVGDWLFFKHMGAYTIASATTFNGFPLPKRLYSKIVTTPICGESEKHSDNNNNNLMFLHVSKSNKKNRLKTLTPEESPSLAGYEEYFNKQQRQLYTTLKAGGHTMFRTSYPKCAPTFPPTRRQKTTTVGLPINFKGSTTNNTVYPFMQTTAQKSIQNLLFDNTRNGVSGGAEIDYTTDSNKLVTETATATKFGSGHRPKPCTRPVAVRPVTTSMAQTSNSRLATVKSNHKLLASLLRTAYSNRN